MFPFVSAFANAVVRLAHLYCCRWLGQNSKQGKLNRQLTDIQAKMRLKVSADKLELRQSYLPSLFPYVVKPLMDQGVVSGFVPAELPKY